MAYYGIIPVKVKATTLESNWPNQPSFLARTTGTIANVTGDGTLYHIIFGSEIFDQGSDYDTGTAQFTAPVTGRYHFSGVVTLLQLSGSYTIGLLRLSTSNRLYSLVDINWGAARNSNNDLAISYATLADCDAADVVFITITISGGTKTIDVYGEATDVYASFTGFLEA